MDMLEPIGPDTSAEERLSRLDLIQDVVRPRPFSADHERPSVPR